MWIKRIPFHRHPAAVLIATTVLCTFDPGHASEPQGAYRLTIENTNPGQNFSPPVIILHRAGYRLFELGEPATLALWRLAEDGVTAEFLPLAGTEPAVHDVMVGEAVHRRNSPLLTIEFEASTGLMVSLAAMLSLTNDGFIAARSVALPTEVADSTRIGLHAFDAGSEANTELCAHVPCRIHNQRMTEGAEGVVSEHPGIRGDADLPLSRGWIGPWLGMLTITRLR